MRRRMQRLWARCCKGQERWMWHSVLYGAVQSNSMKHMVGWIVTKKDVVVPDKEITKCLEPLLNESAGTAHWKQLPLKHMEWFSQMTVNGLKNNTVEVIDFSVAVILHADISKYCLSACLLLVAHLVVAKCNYLKIEKEILTVVTPNSQKYIWDWPGAFTSWDIDGSSPLKSRLLLKSRQHASAKETLVELHHN